MSLMTTDYATPSPFASDPFYTLGIADAYDEYMAGEDVHILKLRADQMLDAAPNTIPSTLYVSGYATTVIGLLNGHMAEINAQAEVAQTWLARKQGRETSTLHTRASRAA